MLKNRNLAVMMNSSLQISIIPRNLFLTQEIRQNCKILVIKLLTIKVNELYKDFTNNMELTLMKYTY